MSEKKNNTLIHDALVLFAITVIAALALGFVYELTKGPIMVVKGKAKAEAYQAVFPEMISSTEWDGDLAAAQAMLDADPALEGTTIDEVLVALDGSANVLGYAMTITNSGGFGGNVTMTMGITVDGTIKSIKFTELEETPGVGDKIKDDAFTSQFAGAKVGQYSFAKKSIPGDTEVEAVSGATFSTTAAVKMVNAGLKFVSEMGGAK